jgi:phage gp36-like protein
MPFYISQASIEQRQSEEAVNFAADDDGDQDLDEEKVAEAIRDAEAEVNSYVAVCFELPLPGVTDIPAPEANASVPPELRRVAVDIAMYRMVPEHDRLTKERRKRYEDAVAWLEKLAAKKVTLTVAAPASGGVTRYGPDRIMTRDKMDGLI